MNDRRFKVLDELVKHDKHREIQNIWWRPIAPNYEVTQQMDCLPQRIKVWTNRLADTDTELAFAYVRKTGPEPDIQVRYGFESYQPAFHERLRLDEWCEIAVVTATRLLYEFAEPPSEALSLIDMD